MPTYTPFARHFDSGFALPNVQRQAATGRKLPGLVPTTSAKRALMQGPLAMNAPTDRAPDTEAAMRALGNDAIVDSPEPVSLGGGSGPSSLGAAPGGLGTSSGRIGSTRGPGEAAEAGKETSGPTVSSLNSPLGRAAKSRAMKGGASGLLALATPGVSLTDVPKAMFKGAFGIPGLAVSLATEGLDALTDVLGQSYRGGVEEDAKARIASGEFGPEELGAYRTGLERAEVISNPLDAFMGKVGLKDIASIGIDPTTSEIATRGLGQTSRYGFSIADITDADIKAATDRALGYSADVDTPTNSLGGLGSDDAALSALGRNEQEAEATPANPTVSRAAALTMQGARGTAAGSTGYGGMGFGYDTIGGLLARTRGVPGYERGGAATGTSTPGIGSPTSPGDRGYADPNESQGLAGQVGIGGSGIGGGSDAGDDGSDSIICCALREAGYLDDATWAADQKFGDELRRNDPEAVRGYHAWARPVVKAMKARPWFCKLVWFVARPWAREMAHREGHDNGSRVGRLMLRVGVPVCRFIGIMAEIMDEIRNDVERLA